jgi:hypothetical protein
MNSRVYNTDLVGRICVLAQTNSPRQVAQALGLREASLRTFAHRNGIKFGRDHAKVSAWITLAAVAAFRREAARRGIRTQTLLRLLLMTVARENLFDAILDDRGQ